MQVSQAIVICLIIIAMIAIAVFAINVAWELAELIVSAVVVVITMIGSTVLTIGSIVIGLCSWVALGIVSLIVGLIVYLKNRFRKDK